MSREPIDTAALEAAVRDMLIALRVDDDPETVGTPARVAEFWSNQLISGYRADPAALFNDAIEDKSGTIVSLIESSFTACAPITWYRFSGTWTLPMNLMAESLDLAVWKNWLRRCRGSLFARGVDGVNRRHADDSP